MYRSNSPPPIDLPVLRSRTSLIGRRIGFYLLEVVFNLFMAVCHIVWSVAKFVIGFFVVVYLFKLLIALGHAQGGLPTCTEATGQFTVNVNGFTAPNGQPWNAHGLNVDLWDAQQNLQGIVQNYPGMTMARIVTLGDGSSLADIDKTVQAYTSKGIVVELEDHANTQNGNNVAWYTQLANAYKNNPYVFLETPNEPSDPNTAQHQIDIIRAIRAAGFNNPIGIQPLYGWNSSNVSTVTDAVGTKNLFLTPHIYGAPWQQSAIDGAKAAGLYPVIDEFGNAMDGFTIDAQGQAVIDGIIAANKAGDAGAIFWAAGNGYHADGADSAFLKPDGSAMTSVGQDMIQPWLSGSNQTATCVSNGPVDTQSSSSPADTAQNICASTNQLAGPLADIIQVCANPAMSGNAINAALCADAQQAQAQLDQATGQVQQASGGVSPASLPAPPSCQALSSLPSVTQASSTMPSISTPSVTTPTDTSTNSPIDTQSGNPIGTGHHHSHHNWHHHRNWHERSSADANGS